MGKSRGKGKNNKKAKMTTEHSTKYTVNEVLDKADGYVDSFEYPMAQRFCQRALEMEPDNLRALETCGVLLLELEDMENAKKCFGRAIEIQPDEGHTKYMYMGQLMTGQLALQCFQKGIQIMKHIIEQAGIQGASSHQVTPTPQDLSNAYCSISEIFLTDECMSEEAENKCEDCLKNAIEVDPENADGYHLYASFWLSKDDKQKAKEMIDKGVSLWLPLLKKVIEKPETEESVDPVEACQVNYQSRMNAAKILIEVENYELATEILELLLDEEDQVIQVWYMLGWAHHLQGDDYKTSARYYLTKGKELGNKDQSGDKEVVKHIEELLEKLGPDVEEKEGEEMEIKSDSDEEEAGDASTEMEH